MMKKSIILRILLLIFDTLNKFIFANKKPKLTQQTLNYKNKINTTISSIKLVTGEHLISYSYLDKTNLYMKFPFIINKVFIPQLGVDDFMISPWIELNNKIFYRIKSSAVLDYTEINKINVNQITLQIMKKYEELVHQIKMNIVSDHYRNEKRMEYETELNALRSKLENDFNLTP